MYQTLQTFHCGLSVTSLTASRSLVLYLGVTPDNDSVSEDNDRPAESD